MRIVLNGKEIINPFARLLLRLLALAVFVFLLLLFLPVIGITLALSLSVGLIVFASVIAVVLVELLFVPRHKTSYLLGEHKKGRQYILSMNCRFRYS